MKQLKKTLLTLVALLAVTMGAWADELASSYSSDATLNNVTVSDNMEVTIATGVTVTINNGLNITSGTLTVTGPGTLIVNGAKGTGGGNGGIYGGTGGNGGVAISGNIIVQGGATVTATGGTGGNGGNGDLEGGNGGNGGVAFAGTLTYKSGTVTANGGSGGSGGWGEDMERSASSGSAGKAFANDVDFTQTTGYSVTNGTSTIGSVLNQRKVVISGGSEPAAATTYTVSLKDNVKDADKWTISPNPAEEGQTVTLQYNGRLKVKSVKATSDEKPAEAAPALSITSPSVGQVIGSDGKNYAAASVPSGVTKVAMIAYVSGSNGLAIALADEGKLNWATAKSTCEAKTPAFTGGTWKLPSKDEWKQMFSANGDNEGSYTGLNTTITNAGGTTFPNYSTYWSSSESETGVKAYSVSFYDGNVLWSYSNEVSGGQVRACLAFTVEQAAKPAATVTTAPTGAAIVGVGKTTALVSGGVADGGTLMYAVTTTNTKPTSTAGFSDAVPTAQTITASGKVYVWYYVKGDDTHSDSEIAATAIEVPVADIVWDVTNVSDIQVYSTFESYTKEGVTLSGNADEITARWRSSGDAKMNGIAFSMYESGGYTFTAPSGKKFTKIEMTLTGSSGWEMANLGNGWNFNADWGKSIFTATWTGSAASTVGLLTDADGFSGNTAKSIVFYLSE